MTWLHRSISLRRWEVPAPTLEREKRTLQHSSRGDGNLLEDRKESLNTNLVPIHENHIFQCSNDLNVEESDLELITLVSKGINQLTNQAINPTINQPSNQLSNHPANQPSIHPTNHSTKQPTYQPTNHSSIKATKQPTDMNSVWLLNIIFAYRSNSLGFAPQL